MKYKSNFLTNQNQLSQIKEWLNEEDENTGEGFLCNWNAIFRAFNEKRLITLIENDLAIGFIVFEKHELVIEIVIAEIKPSHRKKGLGRLLIENVFEKFKKEGILVAELSCSPASTERIWKKLGFLKFPESSKWNGETLMFKPLIENFNPIISENSKDDNNIYSNCNIILKDSFGEIANWEIMFKENSRELIKPIIYPAFYKWKIIWKENGKIIFEDEIDRMSNKISFKNFIIITELQIE